MVENLKQKIKTNPTTVLRTIYHSAAHFSNDLFLAFFAPTLPVLITQMNLLKVQAGILNLGLELTAFVHADCGPHCRQAGHP